MKARLVTAMCPTFHRGRLLSNVLACYLAQDHPADRRELIILDDGNDFSDQHGDGWRLISMPYRFPSLPEKYNYLFSLIDPRSDAVMIAEDDDIYNSFAVSAHATALGHGRWSKPSQVLSTYTGTPQMEPSAGRFFASICVSCDLWRAVGGIPNTKRADFDQQFMSLLQQVEPPVDTLNHSPGRVPGYCFRYGSTGMYHGQHFMGSPDCTDWYDRVPRQRGNRDLTLHPEFDEETRAVYAQCSLRPEPATPV